MGAFIEAVDLHKTYRVGKIEVPALRGISFGVQKGEFVSVVGPSGSGKSTLFYLLGGLTRADSGRVLIDGVDFAQLDDAERTRMRKRKIGFVFQKFNLLPTLDARSNIEIAVDIAGPNGNRDAAFFERIVTLLGVAKRLDHRPSELSGGEQQRVALARALITQPRILLADEPTGDLDGRTAESVFELIARLHRDCQLTSLIATHCGILTRSKHRIASAIPRSMNDAPLPLTLLLIRSFGTGLEPRFIFGATSLDQ